MSDAIKVYPVATRAAGYDGCGAVMAAISHDEVVKVRYLRDICPDFDDEDDGINPMNWLIYGSRPECKQAALELEQAGRVIVGMASSWTVIEY